MNIAFSTDDHYAPYLSVSILSILKNNADSQICFYILDFGISETNKNIIKDIVYTHNQEVSFISINKEDFSNFPMTISYISLATYARLNIAEYIPNIEKLLYIDVDTLTNGSLKELWDTDISKHALAACKDFFIEIEQPEYKAKIGLENHCYFNAGVLLINMNKWKELNVLDMSLEWLDSYKEIIEYQDQDILNGIFKDKVKFINSRFNFTPSECGYIKHRKNREIQFPAIIYHYTGPHKFWTKKCSHLKANLGYATLKEISKKYPKTASTFEGVDAKTKIKRFIKEIRYKFIYKIF
jgi:UDP-galactose--lipooligosaccharide galactosyltransferase